MKFTKKQEEIIKKYSEENNISVEKTLNYMVAFLEQEMEN